MDNRGRPWHDKRAVLNSVLWVLGTGAQWAEMPDKYPPYQTCHRRFQAWVRDGTRQQRLYISSFAPDAQRIAHAIRSHWSVENRLHPSMDVTFNDDKMRA